MVKFSRGYTTDDYGNVILIDIQHDPKKDTPCINPRTETLDAPVTPEKGKRLIIEDGKWKQILILPEHTSEIIDGKIIYRPKNQIERYVSGIDEIPKGMKLSEDKKEIISKTLDEQLFSGEISVIQYNEIITEQRRQSYMIESDGLFFAFQRGEIDRQVWIDKVNEIKERYPKK